MGKVGKVDRELKIRVIITTKDAETVVKNLRPPVQHLTGSFEDLEAKLKAAIKAFKSSAPASKEYAVALQEVERYSKLVADQKAILGSAIQDVDGRMLKSKNTSAQMGQALLALNYTVRDAPYFFRNFSLGVLAVGNNLNPLIDSVINARKEAQRLGSTFGRELKNALIGGGGIVFAFSLLVSAMQAVIFYLDKTDTAGKETEDRLDSLLEKVKELTASFRELAEARVLEGGSLQTDLTDALEEQRKLLAERKKLSVFEGADKRGQTDFFSLSQVSRIKEIDEELEKLSQRIADLQSTSKTGGVTGEVIAKYVDFLQEAKEGGSNAILDMAKNLKLSDEAFTRLARSTQQWRDNVLSLDGKSIAPNITPEEKFLTLDILAEVKVSPETLSDAIEQIQEAYKQYEESKRPDKSKVKKDLVQPTIDLESERIKEAEKFFEIEQEIEKARLTGIENIYQREKALAEYEFEVERQKLELRRQRGEINDEEFTVLLAEKQVNLNDEQDRIASEAMRAYFETLNEERQLANRLMEDGLAKELDALDMLIDKERQALMLRVASGEISEERANQLQTILDQIQEKESKDIEDKAAEKATADTEKEFQKLMSTAERTGEMLYNAFQRGEEGLRGLIESLDDMILKLLFVQAIKGLFSLATGGGFMAGFTSLGFSDGGIVPKYSDGGITGGNIMSGDVQLGMFNSREMILNLSQQTALFNYIKSMERLRLNENKTVDVNVRGRLESRGNKFISDFKHHEGKYNSNIYIGKGTRE